MIAKVEYTEAIPLRHESSLVEGIYYNANDRTVVIDLQDRIYRYKNVDRTDAIGLANAFSVGGEYQRFKRKFGPGEALGDYEDIEWQKVPTNVIISNDRNITLYQNGALVAAHGTVSGTTTNVIPVAEERLNLAKDVDAELLSHKVGFVVGAGSEIKYHTLYAKSVADAVLKVSELGKMLNLEFKVKEVTVYFG